VGVLPGVAAGAGGDVGARVVAVGAEVAGAAAGVGCDLVDAGVDLVVGVAARGVNWRAAVGAGSAVRAVPGVEVAMLAAGGSGLDVSRLRGLTGVGVPRAGAAGATTAGGTFAGT